MVNRVIFYITLSEPGEQQARTGTEMPGKKDEIRNGVSETLEVPPEKKAKRVARHRGSITLTDET